MPKIRGQAALEYLLVGAAGLAVLALLVPVAGALWGQGLFALDAMHATAVAAQLDHALHSLALEGSGARVALPVRFFHDAEIKARSNSAELKLVNPDGSVRIWSVTAPAAMKLSGSASLRGKKELVLKRTPAGAMLAVR